MQAQRRKEPVGGGKKAGRCRARMWRESAVRARVKVGHLVRFFIKMSARAHLIDSTLDSSAVPRPAGPRSNKSYASNDW